MSNAPTVAHDAHGSEHDASHAHPSDLRYIKIAVILAVLTLIEVMTYTFDLKGHSLIAVLIPVMILKFGIVASFFMHLKFDAKLFTAMFVAGLAFAIVIYSVMLTVFEFW